MNPAASQRSETVTLPDGRSFALRPLRPDDLDALRRAFRRLTPEEVEYRFLYRSRELPAFIEHQVQSLDPARDVAFVLDDGGEIRAVADFHLERAGADTAEFGLIVGQAVSGHGLGRLLMQRLIAEARARSVTLRGLVRRDNARMLDLCHALGGRTYFDPGELELVEVEFPQP